MTEAEIFFWGRINTIEIERGRKSERETVRDGDRQTNAHTYRD